VVTKRLLEGRRAVVTGASKGLGREVVTALAAQGAKVAAFARPSAELKALADNLGAAFMACPCDVRSPDAVRTAMAMAAEALGGIDVLVNNAAQCGLGRIDEVADEAVRSEVETNLLGPIWCVREAAPHLRASGAGHIVNVTSEAVNQSPAFLGVYTATKAGLEALSGTLKRELLPQGIRVTVLRVGRMSGSALQTDWDSAQRARFYESVRANGLDAENGQAMDPGSVAKALVGLLTLPADVVTDLMVVRGR
jgi:meso-butanediol dehydrogenase/(S,S)-butanediol dehydrogenase/diacetyl reductase